MLLGNSLHQHYLLSVVYHVNNLLAVIMLDGHANPNAEVSFSPPEDMSQGSSDPRGGHAINDFHNTVSIEGLQTEEQRLVLDTVAQIRKCGLESILSLPQLVVCGDQSTGKSSVLEALTEIPFPRNDNLCTRFATEIILRRSNTDSLTIKIIPDAERNTQEQDPIKAFTETITDFSELPGIMDKAMLAMGVGVSKSFAKDVLSVLIEGPTRPQLTLVDLPGLIQNPGNGITDADVAMVKEITQRYIEQPRTICLAVVAAINDHANQGILGRVQKVDSEGERTLGIITKPDRVEPNSGSERAFLDLANNRSVFLKLGWHVLRNRNYEERDTSFLERNMAETAFFATSNFKVLQKDCVGIDSLRGRLSLLLFEHVKQELPRLRDDLEMALTDAQTQLDNLGSRRSTLGDCKNFLMKLSLDYHSLCKAAVSGHYEGDYFKHEPGEEFSPSSLSAIRRLRALIQYLNTQFSDTIRTHGHRFQFPNFQIPKLDQDAAPTFEDDQLDFCEDVNGMSWAEKAGLGKLTASSIQSPIKLDRSQALKWVTEALIRNRGRELPGNFNPLVIGELFWEQASNWNQLALDHMEHCANICTKFLDDLLQELCPKDIRSRLRTSIIQEALRKREAAASEELKRIMEDIRSYPLNYNHYYTDNVAKNGTAKRKRQLKQSINAATTHAKMPGCTSTHTSASIDIDYAVSTISKAISANMDEYSCENILDCLLAIYKVHQKTFVANVTTQVIERHIVRGLEDIVSPVVLNQLSNSQIEFIASEPTSTKRERDFLEDRISKLNEGRDILRGVMRDTIS
ncbi:dynamin family protein-like protein [Glonium stellatum]|uniref:Dynamin family protein-like protein n=1 Tax=Glonium stellatum TaxID=574774 RepID=A0A8E2FBT0_9PEZI|nr:dynamin family protein-like protein [Glonium stellatum]